MVCVLEHRDAGAAGELAGDLHAVLHGLCAGVHEQRLVLAVTGNVLREQLGDAHVWLVGVHREERVRDLADLLAGSCDDGLVGVADRGDTDATAHVDELVAINVDDDRIVRTLDVDGEDGVDARGDDSLTTLVDLARARARDLGDELALLSNFCFQHV